MGPSPLSGRLRARLLVFDLDGTLVDSKDDIADALNRALGIMGYAPLPLSVIGAFVGNGVNPLIARTVQAAGHPEREGDLRELFRDLYAEGLLNKTTLFPGVAETLARLAGRFRMGLITNKPIRFTRPIVEGLGLAPLFGDAVYGGDSLPVGKPDPASFFALAKACGVDPANAVMVGDSAVDVLTAKNAGAASVGVTYGFRDRAELVEAGVDAVIDRFADLETVVEEG
ncbi:MAG: HAD-IA family hydrolase [Nitrospinae bacterium]|nr:HAD-IA family hydrolase [Nitrospinota bacterium]